MGARVPLVGSSVPASVQVKSTILTGSPVSEEWSDRWTRGAMWSRLAACWKTKYFSVAPVC